MAEHSNVGFDFQRAFDGLFRESYGRIAAALAKEFRDLELAEDSLQEALEVAAGRWPQEGLPENAAGWLYVVARRKAIDQLRKQARQNKRTRSAATEPPPPDSGLSGMYGAPGPADERLSLIFACCHPAISEPAQIALTLHTLTGVSTAEIAAGFLLKETAVAQRIVRAKRKIKEAGIPFSIPDIESAPERLDSVLSVIYLIFNAGYTAHKGSRLIKINLCDEALFLSRMLAQLLPGNSEIRGLLALLLFQHSRRHARVAEDGSPVLLGFQDRSLWDKDQIREAIKVLGSNPESNSGAYSLQARIAAVHATSPDARQTNWMEILQLYDQLQTIHPTAIVILNRSVAISKAIGPLEALECLEDVDLARELDNYRYYHSTRAEFLLELARKSEAIESFQRALELTENEQERVHLKRRIESAN